MKKRFWISSLFLCFGFLQLVSCSHSQTSQKATAIHPESTTIEGKLITDTSNRPSLELPPADYKPAVPMMLGLDGHNREGQFSRDGRHILFLSSDRHLHSNPQIYEFELVTKKVRRLTFDDGVARKPRYLGSGDRFVYMSTADETKETRNFVKVLNLRDRLQKETDSLLFPLDPNDSPSYDLYVRTLKSSVPTRLTHTQGYDGEPFESLAQGHFYSVAYSKQNGYLQPRILQWSEKSLRPQVVATSKTPLFYNLIEGSKSKWFAWLGGEKPDALQIYVADSLTKKPRELLKKPAAIQSLSIHPNQDVFIFSANFSKDSQYELYTLSLDGSCLKRLTYSADADFDPVFSPDGKAILFASRRGGTDQLYLMDYQPPGSCEPQP